MIVAVSGGADSVCLLHVLRELTPQSLAGVVHLNHQLRGESSDADERFVTELAEQFGLRLYCVREPVAESRDNLEQAGRRARRRLFEGLRTAGECDFVAVGHTRDDQAETVLFRFLRGSGLAGLSGIAPAAEGIIRPLIDVTRKEIEEFLRGRNIEWREDASNADLRFARNRIRHELLPQLARDWNPQIADALAKLADLAQEDESRWSAEIEAIAAGEFVRSNTGVELRYSMLSALPRGVARRLVRRAIRDVKGDLRQIDYQHVESVLDIRRNVRLPFLNVTRSFDWVRFERPESADVPGPQEVAPPGTFPSPDGGSLICVEVAQISDGNACATLDMEACWFQSCSPLVLRGWRPGDHYRPAGHARDHKIQEMFQKARVPSWRRASWPILTSGDKILWSRQFGVAHEFAAPGETGTLLRIREVL